MSGAGRAAGSVRSLNAWVIDSASLHDFMPVGRILALFGLLYGLALTTFFITDIGLPTTLVAVGLVLPWFSLPLAGVLAGKRPRSLTTLTLVITAWQVAYLTNNDNGCCAGGHVLALLVAPMGLLALGSLLCFLTSRTRPVLSGEAHHAVPLIGKSAGTRPSS